VRHTVGTASVEGGGVARDMVSDWAPVDHGPLSMACATAERESSAR
jgi:hypothetical protein